MANLQSESRRLYSWWWDSHIPKNSKWIQENLADMDAKVKTMIKLIEADADSFARRAEMYYKKRPELMKLVEELYRAYRALAERYDHTTVELRHAHKAMVDAFPNQIPFDMIEDSASSCSEPHKEDFQKYDGHEGDSEVESLKRTLLQLQTEKEALNLQYQLSLNKLSKFEKELNNAQKDVRGFDEFACKAEIEIKIYKEFLAELVVERKVDGLELISALEMKIRETEESVKMFKDQSEEAEDEINTLKQQVMKLNEVNKDLSVRYRKCLETITYLERDVSQAQDNAKRLSNEVLDGAAKIKTAEEHCANLKRFNQNLEHKMSTKDQELEKLQALMKEEHLRFSELEASLRNLESLHSQSLEEQKVLNLELQQRTEMLREMEISNHKFEGEISSIKDENRKLNEVNASSMISLKIQQNEITWLKKMKEKLEEGVAKQMNQSSVLQVEIYRVKNNIENLNSRYQKLIDQVKLTGLDPESLVYSVKKLQDENTKLLNLCTNLRKNTDLEKLLLESNTKLDGSKEKAEELQERYESLKEEKSELSKERGNLFSQLQIMSMNMQKLLEKNSLLERSLSIANIELQSLRDKSKCFEDFFIMLKNDKSDLLKERESLVSQLHKVEEKLRVSEKKFKELEAKYVDLQSEKKLKVEELQVSLATEKQERADYKHSTDSRLADLQKNVSFLQEECRSKKRDFEEEIERVINKQVEIFILKKLIEDLEEKNFSLLSECHKYEEASEISEKLITELESENLEQQMEAEILLDEIDSLRDTIYQVLKALQIETDCKTAKDQMSVSHVLGEIEALKCSVSTAEYETQRLVIENLVLLSLLGQFQSDGLVLESEKNVIEKDLKTTIQQCGMVGKEKQELLDANRLLTSKLIEREEKENELRTELKMEHSKVETLEEKLKSKEEESQGLNKKLEKLQEGLEEDQFLNGLLEHQVLNVDEILEHRDMEILEAEHILEATNNENEDLHKEVKELRKECEESRQIERRISELTDLAGRQEEEIRKLNTLNNNLESEAEFLHEKVQRQQVREEYLSLELQEKSNEVGLWDAEATSFYFNLQMSSVREVILENKVKELTGVCEDLKDEGVTKTVKMKQMKETISFLESQVSELKTQLSDYDPVITSLAEDIKSLEKRTQALKKFTSPSYQLRQGTDREETVYQTPEESSSTRTTSYKSKDRKNKEEMQLEDKAFGESRNRRSIPEMIEVNNGSLMKVISCDQTTDSLFCGRSQEISCGSSDQIQMFDFPKESGESETSVKKFLISSNEPKRPLSSLHRQSWNPSIESNGVVDKLELSRNIEDKAKIMERLLSDSRKLSSLRISLTDLKSKLETNEKQSRFRNTDFVIVKRQLKEIEDSVLQLANTNEILSKEIEETGDARDIYRKVLMEKSRNGSEKIEQMQSKMQSIEETMVKFEGGVKSKGRSKRLSESRTVILLRDIMHKGGGKRTARKKKNRFCGCIRSSANEE